MTTRSAAIDLPPEEKLPPPPAAAQVSGRAPAGAHRAARSRVAVVTGRGRAHLPGAGPARQAPVEALHPSTWPPLPVGPRPTCRTRGAGTAGATAAAVSGGEGAHGRGGAWGIRPHPLPVLLPPRPYLYRPPPDKGTRRDRVRARTDGDCQSHASALSGKRRWRSRPALPLFVPILFAPFTRCLPDRGIFAHRSLLFVSAERPSDVATSCADTVPHLRALVPSSLTRKGGSAPVVDGSAQNALTDTPGGSRGETAAPHVRAYASLPLLYNAVRAPEVR